MIRGPIAIMKPNVLLTLACACLGLAVLPGCATTRTADVPGTLAVQVNVPPRGNLLLEDRVRDAFTDQVREVFVGAGFDRPVRDVRFVDDESPEPYLLTINLLEWRLNRAGFVECTFTAELRTPQTTRALGLHTNTTVRWFGGPGRFGLARSFEEASEGAIRDLARKVAESELLPGFRLGGR